MKKFKKYHVGHKYWLNPNPKENQKSSYLNANERQRYADSLIKKLKCIYEPEDTFRLHELGCGWGYNLDAIKDAFPNVLTSGNDIWKAALTYLDDENNGHAIHEFDTYDYLKFLSISNTKIDVIISNAHIIHLDESEFEQFKNLGSITKYAILQESIHDVDRVITSMTCTEKNNINLPDCDIQYFLVSNE